MLYVTPQYKLFSGLTVTSDAFTTVIPDRSAIVLIVLVYAFRKC